MNLDDIKFWTPTIYDLRDLLDCATRYDAYVSRYMKPNRQYHGINHITCMYKLSCKFSKYLNRPITPDENMKLRDAIIFHDVVYNPKSKRNEINSSKVWKKYSKLRDCCLHSDWVEKSILATADHLADRPIETDEDRLREWFIGLDLASLAAPWEIFIFNNKLLRIEYCHVSDEEWNGGRTAFIHKLAASTIYKDALLRSLLEDRAHKNIERLLNEGV